MVCDGGVGDVGVFVVGGMNDGVVVVVVRVAVGVV